MLFNSIDFLIFFPIVVLIYFLVPRKIRYIWLLAASYYFYMCWNVKYSLLLLASTLITWISGFAVNRFRKPSVRKWILAGCITVNLGFLFFFKYFDFFWNSMARVLGKVHVIMPAQPFDILLPVGISFYIFQALGYMIDVYRGQIEPEKNPLRYALFVSFFPQLVAGPIERSGNLLKQMQGIEEKKLWNYENVTRGLTMMLWGLFVKMVIADRVAVLVDTVFNYYYLMGTVALAAGAVGFALQIYCDFMGYTTIAIGAARVMGFTLMDNFDTPYMATSISDFWHRWHISLSTWFRDYVYIPLGGSRCSKLRRYVNLIITFLVSGLWHGAAWNYVVWGLLHGIYQVVGNLTEGIRTAFCEKTGAKTESFSFKLGQMLCTFFWVDLAWIFFRAGSLKAAFAYCRRLFTLWDPWNLLNGEIYTLGLDRQDFHVLMLGVVLLVLVDLLRYFRRQTLTDFLEKQCIWFRWAVLLGLMAGIVVFGMYGIEFQSAQFIYFQF